MSKDLVIVKSEQINGIECNFYRDDKGDFWMTRQQIGEVLEYNEPRKAMAELHRRNKERLDRFSAVHKLRTPSGVQETYIYNEMGIYEILMKSDQPKATMFRDKVYEILKALRTGKQTLIETDELKKLKTMAYAKNADARLKKADLESAKLLLEITEKFKNNVAPEAIQSMICRATELMTGQPIVSLPTLNGKHYTAGEIAKELKTSGHKIGCISEANNLKTEANGKWIVDKSPYSNKNVRTFWYNETGREKIKAFFHAVQPVQQQTVLFKVS